MAFGTPLMPAGPDQQKGGESSPTVSARSQDPVGARTLVEDTRVRTNIPPLRSATAPGRVRPTPASGWAPAPSLHEDATGPMGLESPSGRRGVARVAFWGPDGAQHQ